MRLQHSLILTEKLLVVYGHVPKHLNEKEKQIRVMEQALEELNKEQKVCVELFYIKKRSYVEIMEITGYSNNEVKIRLFKYQARVWGSYNSPSILLGIVHLD